MAGVRIKWRQAKLERAVMQNAAVRLKTVGEWMRARVVEKISQGKTRTQGPSRPGQPPHVDTGYLRQSITWILNDKALRLRVGTGVIYGRILELGGPVRPVKAKMLSVPISKEAKKHKGSPRIFPKPLQMIQRKGGPPLLIEERKGGCHGGQRCIIHYVLVPKVVIAKRPYLRPTLEEQWQAILRILRTGRP
jgi:phage gpG-like protein